MAGIPNGLSGVITEHFKFFNHTQTTFKIIVGDRTTDFYGDSSKKIDGVVVQPSEQETKNVDIDLKQTSYVHLILKFEDNFDDEFVFKLEGDKEPLPRPLPIVIKDVEWIKKTHFIEITQQDIGDNVCFYVHNLYQKRWEQYVMELKRDAKNEFGKKCYKKALFLVDVAINGVAENQNILSQFINLKCDILIKLCDECLEKNEYPYALKLLNEAIEMRKISNEKYVVEENMLNDVEALHKQNQAKSAIKYHNYQEAVDFIDNAIAQAVDGGISEELVITKQEILNNWGEHLLEAGLLTEMHDSEKKGSLEKIEEIFKQAQLKLDVGNSIRSSSLNQLKPNFVNEKVMGNKVYNSLLADIDLVLSNEIIPSKKNKNFEDIAKILDKLQRFNDQIENLKRCFETASKMNNYYRYSVAHISIVMGKLKNMEDRLRELKVVEKGHTKL